MQQSSVASEVLPNPAALRPAPDVVAQRMGDDTVLVHLGTNRIYELNRTGSAFWELLAAGCDRAGIQAQLQRRFIISATELDSEIERLIASLLAAQLICRETSA